MKIKYLKLKNWLLMTAMGLLGLSGCHTTKEATKPTLDVTANDAPAQSSPRNEMAVMYGVPTMDFVVKGKVVNEQGKPVSGMQVILVNQTVDISPESMQEDNPFVKDYIANASDTTDAEGNFQCKTRDVPVENQRVIVRDIDGDHNGKYGDQMLNVTFTPDDQTKEANGWYRGTRQKEMNITVK